MKVSELDGAELDFFVAKAEGKKCEIKSSTYNFGPTKNNCYEVGAEGHDIIRWDPYSPSCNWSQGGPIIERERINIVSDIDGWEAYFGDLSPMTLDFEDGEGSGPTPLVAAMRCFVASKFGEEV